MQRYRRRRAPQPYRQYLVLDRDTLADLVRRAVKEDYDDKLLKAVRRIGGSPSVGQLSRLRRGLKCSRLSDKVVEGLRRLVKERREELEKCLLSPAAHDFVRDYGKRIGAKVPDFGVRRELLEITARLEGIGALAKAMAQLGEHRSVPPRAKFGRLKLLFRAANEHLGPWASEELVKYRAMLAWDRVLEPLLEAPGLGWRFLPDKDLQHFADAGVYRELLLLQGMGPIEYAQRVMGGPRRFGRLGESPLGSLFGTPPKPETPKRDREEANRSIELYRVEKSKSVSRRKRPGRDAGPPSGHR